LDKEEAATSDLLYVEVKWICYCVPLSMDEKGGKKWHPLEKGKKLAAAVVVLSVSWEGPRLEYPEEQ